mmetsp:Transcript_22807/g.73099  ORF Transcript_22807/g.73099 Transcript_22807/m.73099 type:complete len:218 (-) Transcript_22807:247-900(-)
MTVVLAHCLSALETCFLGGALEPSDFRLSHVQHRAFLGKLAFNTPSLLGGRLENSVSAVHCDQCVLPLLLKHCLAGMEYLHFIRDLVQLPLSKHCLVSLASNSFSQLFPIFYALCKRCFKLFTSFLLVRELHPHELELLLQSRVGHSMRLEVLLESSASLLRGKNKVFLTRELVAQVLLLHFHAPTAGFLLSTVAQGSLLAARECLILVGEALRVAL